jgi:DNA invertase Pin-like site-specific DNA recombinase
MISLTRSRILEAPKRKKNDPPHAFGYGRLSKGDDKEQNSQQKQEDTIGQYYDSNLAVKGIAWGVFDFDNRISATTRRFHLRPAGSRLVMKLHKGDHLIVTRTDRIFRSMKDFGIVRDWLDRHDIRLHVIDFIGSGTLDTSTPFGDFILNLSVLLAQFEAQMISQRTKEGLARSKKFAHKLRSTKIIKNPDPDGHDLQIVEPNTLLLAKKLRYLIDHEGLTSIQVRRMLQKAICERTGKRFYDARFQWTDVPHWRLFQLLRIADTIPLDRLKDGTPILKSELAVKPGEPKERLKDSRGPKHLRIPLETNIPPLDLDQAVKILMEHTLKE